MQSVLPLIGTARQRLLNHLDTPKEQITAPRVPPRTNRPRVKNPTLGDVLAFIVNMASLVAFCGGLIYGTNEGYAIAIAAVPIYLVTARFVLRDYISAYAQKRLAKTKAITVPTQPKPMNLPDIRSLTWEGHRALIYDAKQDILSLMAGMRLTCPISTLNPFDERCVSWDMAADITAPATAQQVASILIPEEKNASQPFFSDAARHLLSGVLMALMKKAPGGWTFRDVVVAMKSKDRLAELLSGVPETHDLVGTYLDARESSSIMSTVATKMAPYEVVAAAWSRARGTISLRQWLKDESILVLGNDEAHRFALDAINRVIFKRLTELLLSQRELSPDEQRATSRRTWIFLDEAREAGDLEGLSTLLTKGRSKGVCIVLGFQDIEGMRDAYGKERANEIVAMCANKAVLRLESPETAEWAGKIFGEYEQYEIEQSWSQGQSTTHGTSTTDGTGKSWGSWLSGASTTHSRNSSESINRSETQNSSESHAQKRVKRDAVLASEFMGLPVTSSKHGLTGYYVTRAVGAYKAHIPGDKLARALVPPDPTVPNVKRRSEDDQYLRMWDAADRRRLRLSLQPKVETTGEPPTRTKQPAEDPPRKRLRDIGRF